MHFHPLAELSHFERCFLGIVWLAVLAKCAAVWWAVPHYHMPFSSMWVILPTLIFAALATGLWVAHHED